MAVIVVPNVIFTACVFFSLATLTRSLMATYAGLVAMFFGYALAGNLLSDIENERLASIIDPFGSGALAIATKYWTVVERNTQVLALDGVLLTNRLLWVGVALAVFLQVVAYNKYVGFLLMILFIVGGPALGALDFNHNLYWYGGVPNAPYSDMNGYGHFVKPVFFFSLYWSFFAVLLLSGVHLLWPRGSESGMRLRIRLAADRLTGTVKAVTALAALAFLSTGAYIFYNTNILNEYVPGDLQEERQARFEKDYKQYEGIPQPRITAVYTEVDLFPETRGADIRGTYSLENKTDKPIEALHVIVSTSVDVRAVDIPGGRKVEEDDELGYAIYALEEPLEPGGTLEMQFDVSVTQPGFVNHGSNTALVQNGTFINNVQYFPHLGYSRAFELQNPNDRRKHGLAAVQRMPEIDDEAARLDNYISTDAEGALVALFTNFDGATRGYFSNALMSNDASPTAKRITFVPFGTRNEKLQVYAGTLSTSRKDCAVLYSFPLLS